MIKINGLSIIIIFNRFIARLKHVFRFSEIISWEYETCGMCGMDYRLAIGIEDSKWITVNGKSGGCLCLNCFLKMAEKKNITIDYDDFIHLWVFNPHGNCFDFIDRERV
jgi:hypothetical protein